MPKLNVLEITQREEDKGKYIYIYIYIYMRRRASSQTHLLFITQNPRTKLLKNRVGKVSWDRRKQKLNAKIESDALIMMRWAKLGKGKSLTNICRNLDDAQHIDLLTTMLESWDAMGYAIDAGIEEVG
jgi:hypothetical protein